MAEATPIPGSWESIPIDLAGSLRLGRQRSPANQTGRNSTKYLRSANITPVGLDLRDVREMDFSPRERELLMLMEGDVLLVEASGSATHVGRTALWTGELDECCYQNHIIRFRPHVALPEYAILVFCHYARSGVFSRTARGLGIQHLSVSRLSKLPFPLPPLAEQRRIAEEADEKLAELREARERLESARRRLIEQTREVLAAAATGRLVERIPSPSDEYDITTSVPTTDQEHSNKANPRQRALFDDATCSMTVGTISLPTVPSTWSWTTVRDAGDSRLGRQRSPRYHHGPSMRPYLRVANVYENRIDTSDVLTMHFDDEKFDIYRLEPGDILLNEGQSPDLVGRPAMYRGEIADVCFQSNYSAVLKHG